MQSLDVYLEGAKVGQLIEDGEGKLAFSYDAYYPEKPTARALSVSLPLQDEPFSDKVSHAFFSGLLPDDRSRRDLARYLGVSHQNTYGLLEEVGGDCAGAVSLYPKGYLPPQESERPLNFLSYDEMATIYQELPQRPLWAGEEGIRLSLAGAHQKLALIKRGDKLALPSDGDISTHIMKPPIEGVRGSVLNEAFCLLLAHRVGLPVGMPEIYDFGGHDVLLVERYDRLINAQDQVRRVHQEDFCQALSIAPERKYQKEGGPGLKDIQGTLQRYSVHPAKDMLALLRLVIFNFIIGNNDAHGKNFSLLHEDGHVMLAPAYDLISTAVYPKLDRMMAMPIGGKADYHHVYTKQWYTLVPEGAGGRKLIVRELEHMIRFVREESAALAQELPFKSQPIINDILYVIGVRIKHIERSLEEGTK